MATKERFYAWWFGRLLFGTQLDEPIMGWDVGIYGNKRDEHGLLIIPPASGGWYSYVNIDALMSAHGETDEKKFRRHMRSYAGVDKWVWRTGNYPLMSRVYSNERRRYFSFPSLSHCRALARNPTGDGQLDSPLSWGELVPQRLDRSTSTWVSS